MDTQNLVKQNAVPRTGTPRGVRALHFPPSLDILIWEVGPRKATSQGKRTGRCGARCTVGARTGWPGDGVILKWLPLMDPLRKGHFVLQWEFSRHLGQGLS